MLRILIVVRLLWPGGVQRLAIAEAEGLKELGNHVDLVFIRDTGRLIYSANINYKIIYDKRSNYRLAGRLLRAITLHFKPQRGSDATVDVDLLFKYAASVKGRYDIVYCFDEFVGLFCWLLKNRLGAKAVLMIHEAADKRLSLVGLIQAISTMSADAVVTNSELNLKILKERGIKDVFEIFPGLTVKEVLPKFRERDDVVLSVTMWDYGRHPEVFIEAAKRLVKGKIVLVGSWADPQYMEEFKRRIDDLKLNDRLLVTGPVTDDELDQYYMRAKCFIRFGYNEKGPGMGSLEALSYGIPMIWNSEIGIKEVLVDGKNGFMVDPWNPQIIVEKINLLFNYEELWGRIYENNLMLARDLSWERHAERLYNVFKETIKKS